MCVTVTTTHAVSILFRSGEFLVEQACVFVSEMCGCIFVAFATFIRFMTERECERVDIETQS